MLYAFDGSSHVESLTFSHDLEKGGGVVFGVRPHSFRQFSHVRIMPKHEYKDKAFAFHLGGFVTLRFGVLFRAVIMYIYIYIYIYIYMLRSSPHSVNIYLRMGKTNELREGSQWCCQSTNKKTIHMFRTCT